MFLFIIGIILFLLSFVFNNPALSIARFARSFRTGGLVLVVLGLIFSCIRQINAGQVGVQSLFGKVQSEPVRSGLNFVNPLATIHEFDTKTQEYTMSAVHNEGEKAGDDAIRILTADGLDIGIDLTVLYRIDPEKAPLILQTIGQDYKTKIVRPVSRTRIRDNAVYYDAISLYSTKRNEFQQRIFKEISDDFTKRGLILEQILVRNISLPESVKTTIESKINAEQEAQKMQFVLQKEKQEAERKRVEAQGIADYQKILSTGLSDKQLQYEMIKAQKELATSPNAKVIIMGGKGSVPIIWAISSFCVMSAARYPM